jgi:hypothetical protein
MWQKSILVDEHTDPRFRRIAQRILTHAETIAREGTIVASWCWRGGHRLGPYWRIAFRDRGRQKSIYLGRSEPLLRQVRQLLVDLKQPQRQEKSLCLLHRQARAELRRRKALWDRDLRARGLYTRGYAVRGTRRLHRLAERADEEAGQPGEG